MSDELDSDDKQVKAHVETYVGMLALFKWGAVFSVIVLIGLAVAFVPHG